MMPDAAASADIRQSSTKAAPEQPASTFAAARSHLAEVSSQALSVGSRVGTRCCWAELEFNRAR